jgi:non-ribosomal peptide synthetase component F
VAVLVESIHDKKYLEHINLGMIFSFRVCPGCIEGVIHYNSSRYGEAAAGRIASHFKHLLQAALADIDRPLALLDILPEQEKQKILLEFNDTRRSYPGDKTIQALFAEQAERSPEGTALVGSKQLAVGKRENVEEIVQITYGELNKRAGQLAGFLGGKGIKPGTPVGIMVDPSVEMFTALLAVLKAGGAYVPIDPAYPEQRKRYAFFYLKSNIWKALSIIALSSM